MTDNSLSTSTRLINKFGLYVGDGKFQNDLEESHNDFLSSPLTEILLFQHQGLFYFVPMLNKDLVKRNGR